jgi:hypothetical protein
VTSNDYVIDTIDIGGSLTLVLPAIRIAQAQAKGGIVVPELKKVAAITLAMTFVGVALGALIGALTENYLLWIGVSGAFGVGFGLTLSYGFLPES